MNVMSQTIEVCPKANETRRTSTKLFVVYQIFLPSNSLLCAAKSHLVVNEQGT